ncbi:MAG: prepilin-type N-terminal cleavage/methylation domain-containing protein [Acidobacteriota bacterium]
MDITKPGRAADEGGFTLLELLVSLALMVVVFGGAFRAFDDARRASETGGMLADGNQNLRMAVMLINRDAIQTGRELPNGGIPIPRGGGAAAIARPSPPGINLTFASAWTTLPSICPGPDMGPIVNGIATDIVTVLFADSTLALNEYPLTALERDGTRMTVDARTSIGDAGTGLKPGDAIWFTNAVGDAIQTVTSVQGQQVFFEQGHLADAFGFNQRNAESGTILQIRTGQSFPTTSATRVMIVTYYIDDVTAPGQVRLMRREGFQPPRLVGTGIENLQFTFDIVDGTTNPTNQQDAVAPNTPSQIRKLNLFVACRSEGRLAQTRQPVRSSVATQVSLRSMSFMDRYR